jgi:hypothetical protein
MPRVLRLMTARRSFTTAVHDAANCRCEPPERERGFVFAGAMNLHAVQSNSTPETSDRTYVPGCVADFVCLTTPGVSSTFLVS